MPVNRPVIIIAAYGTGEPEAQKCLDALDGQLRRHFAGYEVRWAILVDWLIKRFKKEGKINLFARGEPVQGLAELYKELKAAGKTEAVVQGLLVHEGSISDGVYQMPTEGLRVEYGKSLLDAAGRNVDEVLKAVSPYFGKEKEITILIGHGSGDDERANVPFQRMDSYLKEHYADAYMCMIHGSPSPDEILPGIDSARFRRVVFVPLMITAGEHVLHEVVADNPKSWVGRLKLPYKVAPSFSEIPEVVAIYIKSIEDALRRLGAG
jgi:sirohydrochlorin cobaltochelatase